VGLCIGPCGGLGGRAVSYRRGTPEKTRFDQAVVGETAGVTVDDLAPMEIKMKRKIIHTPLGRMVLLLPLLVLHSRV